MTLINLRTFAKGSDHIGFWWSYLDDREADITIERIKKVLGSGANVVLTTKGIDDMCLKLFVEAGAIAVRRVNMEDMRRIAKASGGKFLYLFNFAD